MSEILPYAYRVPRFYIEFPIEFSVGVRAIQGQTRNLSEVGVLVQLQEPLQVGESGTIHMRFGNLAFAIKVRVTHTDLLEAGMNFVFSSDRERQFVRMLARVAARLARSA